MKIALTVVLFTLAAARPAIAAQAFPTIKLHLTWNAPYGDPRAAFALTANCRDTTEVDTLYLCFEMPRRIAPMLIVSGALLFEGEAGEPLGDFWRFERGGINNGGLVVDFDMMSTDYTDTPWLGTVSGSVGYTPASGRGRLDLSASTTPDRVKNLVPGGVFTFARVRITHRRGALAGCDRPMRILWSGAKFSSPRFGVLSVSPGPGARVTWNASQARGRWAAAWPGPPTWVPLFAPPSWAAIPVPPVAPVAPGATDSRLDSTRFGR